MNINIQSFAGSCSCGKTHEISTKAIYIEPNAIDRIADFLREFHLDTRVGLVSDTNTCIYADTISKLLGNIPNFPISLSSDGLHADEHGIEQIKSKNDTGSCSAFIAVGSGTIHDLTRYIANEQVIPFLSVPTAASVDGFVSTVSAMTLNGCKKTLPGTSPLAVFADTNIFCKAPHRLTASGAADLLGKFTALLDWKVSHMITGEYICDKIIELENTAIEKVISSLDGLVRQENTACENLMYALLLSGLAMQMTGNSRPASGAEHHMSHFWEMHVINPETDAYHGEKVGVGLIQVCKKYKELLKIEDINSSVKDYSGIPCHELKEIYDSLYPEIEEENKNDPLHGFKRRHLTEHFKEIQDLVSKLPSEQDLIHWLEQCRGVTTMEGIGLSEDIIPDSLSYCSYVRQRLTLLRIIGNVIK